MENFPRGYESWDDIFKIGTELNETIINQILDEGINH